MYPTTASVLPHASATLDESPAQSSRREGVGDDLARLVLDAAQVVGALEALRVKLVDVLGARGSGGEPTVLGHHLESADGRAIARRRRETRRDGLPRELRRAHALRCEPRQHALLLWRRGCVDALVRGGSEALGEGGVELARVAPRHGGDLGGEEAEDEPILVGAPRAPVAAQERRARALFPAEAERAVDQTVDEPLEPDRHLDEPSAEHRRDAVDHAAAHDGLAHASLRRPARAPLEEVLDRDREIVIRVEQSGAAGDDAMAIVIGIAGPRDVELVA